MDGNDRRDENHEVTRDIKDDETAGSDNQHQLIPRSSRKVPRTEADYGQCDKKPTRSRSRSRLRSKNAFLNFMQDFRQDNNKINSKDLFRLGGQKWRRMSSTEKMPYVKAAKLAQQQSQQNNKNGQQNKPDGNDPSKKTENKKQDEKKKERERRKRSRSRTDDSEAESDSATSGGTVASMTSEDVSDLSS
ncbi:uncharacterized protein [Linepithema humile]|uniref:uncharacterized protein n=1 Tax=Linepithema humile TaxID=83485 RepID=UPI00351F2CBE